MDRSLNKLRFLFLFFLLFFLCFTTNAGTVTLTVGATGSHATIIAAYNACTTATDNYIIEIQADYANTEAKPISLTQKTNLGVLIYPKAAFTITTATAASVISFNGADNVIIDGRLNGSGASSLTITNTYAVGITYAVRFENDAVGNTLRYCTVRGITSASLGVIYFSNATGTTGCDDNTISNCIIGKGASQPTYGINVSGVTAAAAHDNLLVSNCEIVDFTTSGISIDRYASTYTITSNSFYQTASFTPGADVKVIDIDPSAGVTGGHVITGNFIGGRSANCGGAAFTLSASAYQFWGIYMGTNNTGAANIISGNTIQNISTSHSVNTGYFAGIRAGGTANYTIGSSGNGNIIGNTTGTGSIAVSSSGVNSTAIFLGIYVAVTGGTTSVAYNQIGSITAGGTSSGSDNFNCPITVGFPNGAYTSGATVTIDNNTIGNATAANISIPTNGYSFAGIYFQSHNVGIITNNLIQNISATGTTNVATMSGIHVKSTTTVSTYTVSGNTIGNTTANNIVFGSNALMHGIWQVTGTNSTSFQCDNNIVQNINCTSTGTGAYFHGMCEDPMGIVTFSEDTVRNISVINTFTGSHPSFQGFRISSTNTTSSQMVELSAVKNVDHLTSSATNINIAGIYVEGSCSGTIQRCHVSGLAVYATGSGTDARNTGIYTTSTGSWDIYNNVVLLNQGGSGTSPHLDGINAATTGLNTTNVYHNSVKIYGTATSGALKSTAFRYGSATSNTTNIKNNVWQNLRTNGGSATAKHYACYHGSSFGTNTYDYNYLETAAAPIAYWNASGDQAAIANWNAVNAAVLTDLSGTVSIENVFGYSSSAPIPGGGVTYASVPQDKIFCNRASPPWIGAWECTPPTLPVQMLNFSGHCDDDLVLLQWTTATESNNDHFLIERSTNGTIFLPIGKVYGFGNSSVMRNYEFVDNENQSDKISFYRIKQTDYNGQFEYFGPISVRCSSGEIAITPTVSEGVYFITGDLRDAEISIYSLVGEKIAFGFGETSTAVDISSLSSGIYFIKIVTPYGCKTQKVIKR